MKIRCLVAVNGSKGPELIPAVVDCSVEEIKLKKHYQAATDVIIENYDVICTNWVIDEYDSSCLFELTNELYDWSTADETCCQ
mgnify:CR=1 FL=1